MSAAVGVGAGVCHTYGDTYEEALQNAREVLELLTKSAINDGKPLPKPQ